MNTTTFPALPAVPPHRFYSMRTGTLQPAPGLMLLADGRKLAWECYGDTSGPPLYVFHGMPGSRLQAALIHEQAREAGVCLIAPDRPGMGRSSFQPGRSVAAWADDVAALANHLGHARFGVLGLSCGGPHALACALHLADRVMYTGLLAGAGPMHDRELTAGQMPALKTMFGLSRLNPWLPAPLFVAESWILKRRAADTVLKLASAMTAPDRDLLIRDANLRVIFAASLAEAYRQGIRGVLHEAALIARPHGLPLREIGNEVHVYQGGHDRHVPPDMGRYLAESLPAGKFHWFPEAGHLSIVVDHFADVLRDFLWHLPPQQRRPTRHSSHFSEIPENTDVTESRLHSPLS